MFFISEYFLLEMVKPRKGLGLWIKQKVHEVQAQKWSRIGMGIEMENEAEDSVSQYNKLLVAVHLEDVLKIVLQMLEMLLLKKVLVLVDMVLKIKIIMSSLLKAM